MENNRLAKISFAISIIALVFSIVALVNYCPRENLQFDYIGVIIGILALLVTALIGAQVGQYVFVDKKIEKITTEISTTISKEVAEKAAVEPAQAKAMEVVGGLPDDIACVLRGKDMMQKIPSLIMLSEYMAVIDLNIKALKEFKQCKSDALYQSTVDDALESLEKYFERCKTKGGLRILKGQRKLYEETLHDLRSEHLKKCLEYLFQAKELDKSEDNKILNS